MDFIQQLNNWVRGDVIQGKIMIGFVLFFLCPAAIISIRSQNALIKGMFIPFSLLMVINLTYGGYLLLTKAKKYGGNTHVIC